MDERNKLSSFLWLGLARGARSGLIVSAATGALVLTIFYIELSMGALGQGAGIAVLGILFYSFGLLAISPLFGMVVGLLGGGLFWNYTRQFSLPNQAPDMRSYARNLTLYSAIFGAFFGLLYALLLLASLL